MITITTKSSINVNPRCCNVISLRLSQWYILSPMDISLKSHIIIDFDETIATLTIDWTEWYLGIFNIIKSFEPTFSTTLTSKNIHTTQNEMFEKYGKPLKTNVDSFVKSFENEQGKTYSPITGTIELVSSVYSQNKTLYVWSNNDTSTIIPILKSLEIFEMFETIVGREMVNYIKPNPQGFSDLINKNDLPKHLFLMVGNNYSDKNAALASGIDYLDVTKI
ncbi:hypothetical protein COX05_02310 [candidate division WWE3 bacterium CG22_combo_CG10-13_8_21_14_all_39_12]|uniref:HAD family hydrolase n=2 Tax=Katanobacteria TaxID=422282 RepID=A0A2M7X046_UNCKA|nr:MAG: hypothetical protein COX05_02310 [candidate division WWE3 bacterium CG22_combo_CG10-13_8_21_14_all_39_12]PJA39386.1 MAG: hypothetical protein CO179_05270 [candidate division WWE3 bacterium CG_4_9_14_3_um_filter_39_7]